MPKILHIADIHLDSAFSAHFDAQRAKLRRAEVLRCLSGILDRAKEVDILLIAGDLFDGASVSAETVSFLKRKFAEIKNTRVFIAAGNHDAYTPTSVYATEDLGENVHVFSTAAECVELTELRTRVFGASFSESFCDNRITFPQIEKKDGVTDIILVHADLTSKGAESRYNQIDKEFIEKCGADYLALGHIHKRTEIERCGETYYAYPGSPEGRGFDECGDMGFYTGTVENGVADIKFERACIRRMYRAEVDISGAEDNFGAAEIVRDAILKAGSYEDMYRIILKGRIKSGFLSTDIVKEEAGRDINYLELRDETKNDYDIDSIAKQNTICGEFVRIMKSNDADSELTEDAILLGLEALLGGDI